MRELDVPYAATDNPRQRLDLYRPDRPRTDRLPVIVFLHGGGWLQGDKAEGAAELMPYLQGGEYAGVSVGYRLTDEAIWPAQLHDVKAAIRWIRAHAEAYGLDAGRIAVYGLSAGGHLALMLGFTGDVPALEGDLGPHPGVSTAVSGVVNFYGVTEILGILDQPSALDRRSPQAPEALLLGGPLEDRKEAAAMASPVRHVTPNAPPVITIHGTLDRIVPYGQALHLDRALTDAGVTHYLLTVNGGRHGGLPEAVNARAAAFLDRILLGRDTVISTEALAVPESD